MRINNNVPSATVTELSDGPFTPPSQQNSLHPPKSPTLPPAQASSSAPLRPTTPTPASTATTSPPPCSPPNPTCLPTFVFTPSTPSRPFPPSCSASTTWFTSAFSLPAWNLMSGSQCSRICYWRWNLAVPSSGSSLRCLTCSMYAVGPSQRLTQWRSWVGSSGPRFCSAVLKMGGLRCLDWWNRLDWLLRLTLWAPIVCLTAGDH